MPIVLTIATKLAGGVGVTCYVVAAGAILGFPVVQIDGTPLVGKQFVTSLLAFALLLTGTVSAALWYGVRRRYSWFRHVGAAYWYVLCLSGYAASEWFVAMGVDPFPASLYFWCGLFGMIAFFYFYASPGVKRYINSEEHEDSGKG